MADADTDVNSGAANDALSNIIPSLGTQTKARVTYGLDANPDEAAKVVGLEKTTGVPSQVIAPDVDHFDKLNQGQIARDLVMNNGQLRDYVNSHMMAAQVSNDDWGTLDKISQAATKFSQFKSWLPSLGGAVGEAAGEEGTATLAQPDIIGGTLSGAAEGAKEGFGPESLVPDVSAVSPALQGIASYFLTPAAIALRGLSAGAGALSGAAGGAATAIGGESFGRDVHNLVDSILADTGSRIHMEVPGEPWLNAGKEPPTGIHPEIDASKAEINAQGLDQLDAIVKEAQASATKERSLDMFRQFMEQHHGTDTIAVDGDAVAKLYGGKSPAPDDGILGWVPGIGDKIDSAIHTGADVHIPVADWVTHVDPAIAKELHDDTRIWPGGITTNEAKLAEPPPSMIDGALAQTRGASGTEPMFSMGDRKLTLTPVSVDEADPELFKGGSFHTLAIQDDRGAHVGDLTLTPDPATKTLHVEMVNGVAGQWANSFGPGLILDLKRQLRGLYPEYDKLSGVRVSGANAGREVTVNLSQDAPRGWAQVEATRSVLGDAYRPVGETGVDVNIQPSSTYLAHEKAMASAIHDEIAKVSGGKLKAVPVAGIRYGERTPMGVHFPRSGMMMYDLLGQDPVGVGRHEAIHFLRDQGLFTDKEWDTLKNAARDEGWHDRYGINERYASLGHEARTEEAIAEGFREWAGTRDVDRTEISPVGKIFSKLWEFLQGVKQRFAEIFGRVPSADELFTRVQSGEIGSRASEGSAGGRPQFSEEDHLDNLRASGLGLDLKTFQRIQKLVEERHQADVAASERRAETEQAKRQTKEWTANKAAMVADIEPTIRQRPDVAADLFLGSGELYGEKIQQRFTLREGDLTPEQKAALPKHYASAHGLPIDDVAKLFGYTSGDAMVGHLAEYNAFKEGRTPQAMLKHLVEATADRQMEAKYGNLAQNILTEAKDQALSENSLNILHEDYRAAAEQAGVTAVDKDVVKAKAKDIVDRTALNEVDSSKQMAIIGKNYQAAVRSLAAGDPASAVIALERRTLAAEVAAEMKRVEKEKAKFDNLAKRYAKPWDPSKIGAVEPTYSLFIRDQLSKVGMRNGMSPPGLVKAISESGYTDLGDFVTKSEDENKLSGLELPVPDWMLGQGPHIKDYATMAVSEFRELRDSVSVMDKVGRADQKILIGGEAADRAAWIRQATAQIKNKFEPLARQAPDGWRRSLRTFAAVQTSNETLMRRFDGRDPHGIFTETITKPAAEASNSKAVLSREIEKQYKELGPVKDGFKQIDSPFVNPETKRPLPFTRNNLAAVISNIGNEYNLSILAKGYGLDKDAIMKWVESVAKPEDIARAQEMGGIFKGLKAKADNVYQHMYGVAPESVVPRAFTMHGKTYDGWYHPIIGDPNLSRFVNKLRDPTTPETNFYPSVFNAYMKRRTGAVQVIDLTHELVPLKMEQVIHDISVRDFVANTAKIFKDNSFRQAITNHYGKEYMDNMDAWLHRVAGDSSYSTAAVQEATKASNYFRQNVVNTMVGFNPITAGKHFTTASMMSSHTLDPNLFKSVPRILYTGFGQVPASSFRRAVVGLFGQSPQLGDSMWQFAVKNSEELQRRERNWQEAFGVSQRLSSGQMGTLSKFSANMAQQGSKLVAFSDMVSAVPLWHAKYWDEMAANGGDHGDAVREADVAVRLAHGSTAVTNLPTIAAGKGPLAPWFTSLYGFMGTNMQRRIELMHDMNDAGKLLMGGQIKEAAKMTPTILSSLAVQVVWVGMVEEGAQAIFTEDHRGIGLRALTYLFGTVSQSVIGLRDIAYDLTHHSESAGIFPIHNEVEFGRDLAKKDPLGRAHAGKLVQDTCATLGDMFGVCPKPLGKAARYGLDVFNGYAHPQNLGDEARGIITGSQKLRKEH